MDEAVALTVDERRLARATERAVKAVGGLKVAAAEAAIEKSHIQRCYSLHHSASLTIRDAVRIDAIGAREAGHPHILGTMASIIGAVVILRPDENDAGSCLQSRVMDVAIEVGDVARAISEMLSSSSAGGSEVLSTEAEAALGPVADLERATATLRHHLERIAAGTPRPP